jgi:hypothetical protein
MSLKMIFYKSKGILLLSLLMLLTSCGSGTTNKLCPPVVIPEEQELVILSRDIPSFYIRFTNQQQDIMICRGEL